MKYICIPSLVFVQPVSVHSSENIQLTLNWKYETRRTALKLQEKYKFPEEDMKPSSQIYQAIKNESKTMKRG